MIVGLSGLPGSGKDYMARQLANSNSRIISFADTLREIAWDILKWEPENDKLYRLFKESKLYILPGEYENGREFLEKLSDSIKNRFGQDFFIQDVARKINNFKDYDIYITDVRLPKEFNLVKSFNDSKIIWCNFKNIKYTNHLNTIYSHNSQIETLRIMKELEEKNSNIHNTIIWDSKW
jgi:dephospho-CoA kinase